MWVKSRSGIKEMTVEREEESPLDIFFRERDKEALREQRERNKKT
jgi:hypothetical protein